MLEMVKPQWRTDFKSLGRKNTSLGRFGTIEYIEWKLFAIGWDLYGFEKKHLAVKCQFWFGV